MKSTGVVRRIDELGRIVIPKEIRKTLRIKDGENIEISVENDNIILKKYSFMKKLNDFANEFTEAIYLSNKKNIIITDTDTIISISGTLKKDYVGKNISNYLFDILRKRENIINRKQKEIKIIENEEIKGFYVINSIICNGDAIGLIIIFSSDDEIDEFDEKIANMASQFLSKYLAE